MSIQKLRPSEVYAFVTRALAIRKVAYIAGPPTIGKSRIVKQVADDANAKLIDMRLSQKLSEDLMGLPERDEKRGKAIYLPFDDIPIEGDEVPEGYDGWILFLDELSSASEEVLAASYSILLDRMVGGKVIHPKCLVVAAGNRAIDSAIARELPDTIISRVLPCEMIVNHKDWIQWAESAPNRNEAVIEFIRRNPNQLYAPVSKDSREELEIYANPRGWENVFNIVNIHEQISSMNESDPVDASGIPMPKKDEEVILHQIDPVTFHLISASVGIISAKAFCEEYDEAIQLPYPWEVAQSPNSCRIPNHNIGRIRLTEDLAKFFVESDTQTRDSIMSYINRMGGENAQMFYVHIQSKLGQTPSDKKLLDSIMRRLNIDPLLGTVNGGMPDTDHPF